MLAWLLGACFGIALVQGDKIIMVLSLLITLSMWLFDIVGGER